MDFLEVGNSLRSNYTIKITCMLRRRGTTQNFFFAFTEKKLKDKIILHMCTKIHNHMVYGSLEYRVRLTEFFVILGHFFALLPHWQSKKSKFWKNTWRYHWFPLVYHKWQSYHAWFLRYGVWQTEFAILDRFFPFWSPNNPEN